ncbi:MAG: 50S ribosomal protein L23 [Candidatus Omnitrophica bacterium]|nr:50S ribosomal protein L23 [Candidatus Omnitrophota bacterium]
MQEYEIIRYPVITEKSTSIFGPENKYCFAVGKKANKQEIRKAIESIYKVTVLKVNVIKMSGKKRKVRYQVGRTPDWKKAVITLKEGDKIDFA